VCLFFPNSVYLFIYSFRFEWFDKMSGDTEILLKFAREVTANMFTTNERKSKSVLVALKYDASVCVVEADDSSTAQKLLSSLNVNSCPYTCWKLFSNVSDAKVFAQQLERFDLSGFIPEDPNKLKRARYVSLSYFVIQLLYCPYPHCLFSAMLLCLN